MAKPVSDKYSIIPQEALAWLKAKKLKPGFDYRDVWMEEHSIGFTVAKMTQLDLLADVRQLVEDALESGQTFEQFREVLKPMLVKRGWWGQQLMDDPLTGETRTVQLGSDRRMRVIYDTNMRTARAAGQWQRIERTQRAMPYLVYTVGPHVSTVRSICAGRMSACRWIIRSGEHTWGRTAGDANAVHGKSAGMSMSR